MEILERDANIDNLVLLINIRFGPPEQLESQINLIVDLRKRTLKPVMSIVPFSSPEEMQRARSITQKLQQRGVPVFPSIERGAFALRNALDYYSLKGSIDI